VSNMRPVRPGQRSAAGSSPVIDGCLPGSGSSVVPGFVMHTGTSLGVEGVHSPDDGGWQVISGKPLR
jgi:hypothetical protein